MAWEVAGDEWIKSIKTSLSIESDQEELDNALQRLQSNIEVCPGEFFLQSPFVFDPPVIIEDIRIAGPLLPPLTPKPVIAAMEIVTPVQHRSSSSSPSSSLPLSFASDRSLPSMPSLTPKPVILSPKLLLLMKHHSVRKPQYFLLPLMLCFTNSISWIFIYTYVIYSLYMSDRVFQRGENWYVL